MVQKGGIYNCSGLRPEKVTERVGETMIINRNAKWIRASEYTGDVCPVFTGAWKADKEIGSATLRITSLGVYEALLNGTRVGDFILAPGWTSYGKRLQVQTYDVTGLVSSENQLEVTVGKGWYASPMPGWIGPADRAERAQRAVGLLAELKILYRDGTEESIVTDETWKWRESCIRFSEIYDGETYDAAFEDAQLKPVLCFEGPYEALIPQEGEEVREMERVSAKSVFLSPAGEMIVDFGQEVTGYVEFAVHAGQGEKIRILHGEMLDCDGNFYNANYRSAKAEINYTCRQGYQVWHPHLTFFGFRYLKLAAFPHMPAPEQFTAIVLYSDMKRTGYIRCGHDGLNRLVSNVIWGQKGNFLDVPTDCPQRDERLGWTGDAQVFVKAASLNFDVEKFFSKWLRDLAVDQRADGGVGTVVPDYLPGDEPSAAWGDAAVICPWQIYQTYGNPEILRQQFVSMKKWVDYITRKTKEENLWIGSTHFGDWLGLDAAPGSSRGATREDFIASAFYAFSTKLLVKAGQVLGKDMSAYRTLHERIVRAFRKKFPVCTTQTEYVLAIRFRLCEDEQAAADELAERIRREGIQMKTGFVGTPYLLHVLGDHGYGELAYSLLLREEYPSWLYSVGKGATTIWEHWDGITRDGRFWSPEMNSFNHYAYGSVIDWMYEKAAGIRHPEECPGFSEAVIEPHPDSRLGWLEGELLTRNGRIRSRWSCQGGAVRYEIETEVPALVKIGSLQRKVQPGSYVFWSGTGQTLPFGMEEK